MFSFVEAPSSKIPGNWLSRENTQWTLSYIGLHTTPIPLKTLVLKRRFALNWKAIKNSLREQCLPRNLSLNTWVSMGNIFSVAFLSISFLQSGNNPCLWHSGMRHRCDNVLFQCLSHKYRNLKLHSGFYLLVFNNGTLLAWCVSHKNILRISWRQTLNGKISLFYLFLKIYLYFYVFNNFYSSLFGDRKKRVNRLSLLKKWITVQCKPLCSLGCNTSWR